MAVLKKVFSVYDRKAEFFHNPMFFSTKGEAIRSFSQIADDSASLICKYPEDFVLYEIGTFFDSSGQITGIDPLMLGCATEFIKVDKV